MRDSHFPISRWVFTTCSVNSLMIIQKKKRILGGRKRGFEVFGSLDVEGVINEEGLICGGVVWRRIETQGRVLLILGREGESEI